jgi:hypothetical protein
MGALFDALQPLRRAPETELAAPEATNAAVPTRSSLRVTVQDLSLRFLLGLKRILKGRTYSSPSRSSERGIGC